MRRRRDEKRERWRRRGGGRGRLVARGQKGEPARAPRWLAGPSPLGLPKKWMSFEKRAHYGQRATEAGKEGEREGGCEVQTPKRRSLSLSLSLSLHRNYAW